MFKAEICFTNYYHQRMHHKVLDLLILKDSSVFGISWILPTYTEQRNQVL